jgi:hypothetical protein
MRRLVAFGFIVSLFTFGLTACGGSSSNSEARVRVFHASPDAPAVDVLIDGGAVLEDVPFKVFSDFLPVDSGHRQITVTVAGTNTAVIDARVDLDKNRDYMVIAAGKVANIAPIVVQAERSRPPIGSARVRVAHTAPSAPAVDIYVTAAGAGINNATPVLSGVPFGAISDYLTVNAGVYDVSVTLAGTKTVAISAENINIGDRLVATVAAVDNTGGGAPFGLVILDERF